MYDLCKYIYLLPFTFKCIFRDYHSIFTYYLSLYSTSCCLLSPPPFYFLPLTLLVLHSPFVYFVLCMSIASLSFLLSSSQIASPLYIIESSGMITKLDGCLCPFKYFVQDRIEFSQCSSVAACIRFIGITCKLESFFSFCLLG